MASSSEFRNKGKATLKRTPFLRLKGISGETFKVKYQDGLKEMTYFIAVTPHLEEGIYQWGERNPITIYAMGPEFWELKQPVKSLSQALKNSFSYVKNLYKFARGKSDYATSYQEKLDTSRTKILDKLESMISGKVEIQETEKTQTYNDLLSSE